MKGLTLILAILIFGSPLFAVDSGSLSHRANSQYQNGNYHQAYMLYYRALGYAKREGDIKKEIRILLNLSSLSLESQEYERADSLINLIPFAEQDYLSDQQKLIKAQIFLGQKSYSKALGLLSNPAQFKDDKSNFREGLAYALRAEAEAHSNSYENAASNISKAEKILGKSSGTLLKSKGIVALANGNASDALKHFEAALIQSRKKKRNIDSGDLLKLMGDAHGRSGNKAESILFYKRSMELFAESKLAKPFLSTGEIYTQLVPEDTKWNTLLANTRKRLYQPAEASE
jgi:tetratricopeptide (TPR) repeat protein